LQALVVLTCPDEEKAGVLAVYGALSAVLMPLGGILLGTVADLASPWVCTGIAGAALATLALVLRRRLRVFDDLADQLGERRVHGSLGSHWHTHHRYIAGADVALPGRGHFLHPHGGAERGGEEPVPQSEFPPATPVDEPEREVVAH
jgi:hypothetical protein